MMTWDLIVKLLSVLLALAMCWGVTKTIQLDPQPPQYWFGATTTIYNMPSPVGETWGDFIWSEQDSLWTDSTVWADDVRINIEMK